MGWFIVWQNRIMHELMESNYHLLSCINKSNNGSRLVSICHNYVDGLEQDFSNSIANALELLQSCTKPSTWSNRERQCRLVTLWVCLSSWCITDALTSDIKDKLCSSLITTKMFVINPECICMFVHSYIVRFCFAHNSITLSFIHMQCIMLCYGTSFLMLIHAVCDKTMKLLQKNISHQGLILPVHRCSLGNGK